MGNKTTLLNELSGLLYQNSSFKGYVSDGSRRLKDLELEVKRLIESKEGLETVILEKMFKYNQEVKTLTLFKELLHYDILERDTLSNNQPYSIGEYVTLNFVPEGEKTIYAVSEIVSISPTIYRLAHLKGLVTHRQLTLWSKTDGGV